MQEHQTFCFKIVGLVPSAVLMVKGQWCRSQVHEYKFTCMCQAEPRCEELVDFVNWCKPTLILCLYAVWNDYVSISRFFKISDY